MNPADSRRLAALLARISRLIATDAHAKGLRPVQWEVLRYLARANRFSNTAVALCAYLGLTKGTVSQTLMALEAKGFVRKEADEQDRRCTRLSLTPAAKKMLRNDPIGETEAALEGLPVSTRHKLERGLDALLSARLAARAHRPFGQCQDCLHFAANHPEGAPHRCQLLGEKLRDLDAVKICCEQVPGPSPPDLPSARD